MLVHICCSVDSHYFLAKLQEAFPEETLVGYFYNPNIHPYDEYVLRLQDVRRSCETLGIALIEGEYNLEAWLNVTKGLEEAPEKGERCEECFTSRLMETAKKAKEHGIATITTTLLMSPKKSFAQLEVAAKAVEEQHGVGCVWVDFRKQGGTQAQFALAKEAGLYRQNYCGCLYALQAQRKQQEKPAIELFSPLAPQVQPGSIQERLALYKTSQPKRRQRFLNYRLLQGSVTQKNVILPAYFLFYSAPSRPSFQGTWEAIAQGVAVFSKEPAIGLDIARFNALCSCDYKDVKALLASPPSVEQEIALRQKVEGSVYSLTPIIVFDTLPLGKLNVHCEAEIFQDVRELLATV